MRAVLVAIVFALVLTDTGRGVDAQGESARALLGRAQDVLGGATALANVRSLEWSLPWRRYRVLFPDRYRIDSHLLKSATIFDGQRLSAWRSVLRPDAAEWTETPAPNQRATGLRRVAQYAVTFLLRTSPVYPTVSAEGVRTFGPITGTVLVFRSAEASTPPMRVIVDPDTARIQGVVLEAIVQQHYAVQAFSDYRRVADIVIPHTVHTTFWTKELAPLPGGLPATQRFTNVRINSVSAADVDTARATGPE